MPSESRSQEEILRDIAAEREQLVEAIADLRASIDAKRRPIVVIGGALAVGLAVATASKIARRLS